MNTSKKLAEVEMRPDEPQSAERRTFVGGVWRMLEVVLVPTAYALVGVSVCAAHSMVRGGGRAVEEFLGGAAIGVISAVLRITGYHRALSVGVCALLGWIACFALKFYMLAPIGATVGGVVGAFVPGRLRRSPASSASEVPPVCAPTPGVLSLLVGIVVGGFVGNLVGAWLCMIVLFHAWKPSQLSREVGTAALLIPFVGLLGGVIGAVTGARCLYLWTARQQARRPRPEDVIRDYEQWKQSHSPAVELENPDLNQVGDDRNVAN